MRSFLVFLFLWSSVKVIGQVVPCPAFRSSLIMPERIVELDRIAMPTPWSYQRLGVFCKLDVQLERRLWLPVLFRLGDVQRVEAMEGKGPLRSVDLR